MRIFNVAAELAPYSNATGLGAEVAKLLAALVRRGHEVRAIAPLAAGADPSGPPLARRLKPIVVAHEGREVRFTRFEGRTASGVNVDLLQPITDIPRRQMFEAFDRATLELIGAAGAADAACIAWNRECAPLAALDAAPGTGAAHYVAIHGPIDDFDEWVGPDAARRIVLTRRGATDSGPRTGATALAAMLDQGRAIALPMAVDEHPALDATEKASAKAALQAAFGLPVRADVPLTYFAALPEGALPEALGAYLRGEVQAIAIGASGADAGALEALAERYPDRLTVLPDGAGADALLAGADFCAATTDPTLPMRAMSFGAVPITIAACAEGAVDLEPSLASGSAILSGDASATATIEALGRAVTAFQLGKPFRAFATRIQGHVATWPACAERFEQILSSP
jgi:hypothetical protein